MPDYPTVQRGQLWTDPRKPTRRIRVTSVDGLYVTAESWWEDRNSSARTVHMMVSTFWRYEQIDDPNYPWEGDPDA